MKIFAIKISSIVAAVFLLLMLIAPNAIAAGCCLVEPTEQETTAKSLDCPVAESTAGQIVSFLADVVTIGQGGEELSSYIMCKGTKVFVKNCYDSISAVDCTSQYGKNADFDTDRCGEQKIYSCLNYEAATYKGQTLVPKIVDPLCWPEDECMAGCKYGGCWQGTSSECVEGKGFCYVDYPNVELNVPIGGVTTARDIGSYIALLYNYLVGVAVIVAIVMIMYGGFRWVTAAGDSGKISEAKKTMVGAVVGLVLALFSYTLLNTINPALVRLDMPAVKKIRAIYFEVEPVRCQDYVTKYACAENKYKFNLEKGEGCEWRSFGGLGSQCTVKPAPGTGEPGGVCGSGNKCTGGKCIMNIRYAMGPMASDYTTPKNWCSNGEMDMPCDKDADCGVGLLCDQNLYACVGMDSGRPVSAACKNDAECSSGLCYFGQCRSGQNGQSCGEIGLEEGDDDLCASSQGYKCVEFAKGSPSLHNWYCCPPASASRGGERCYVKCTSDAQCGGDLYCWQGNATFVSASDADRSEKVAEWEGVCLKRVGSGERCLNDNGCEEGLKCSDKVAFQKSDPALTELLKAPNGMLISFPEPKIKVGICK
ncbi:MAG: pilin [Patescibacteria group bacterium]|nr:pilin [Patescibacteria group bacterium]